MAFWCYMLRCSDGKFYTGHTDNLDARIAAHLAGKGCDFTARRQPVAFAWAQEFPTRIEALEAEKRIQGWSRAKKEALIAGDWERISQLARSFGARASTSSARTEGVEDSSTMGRAEDFYPTERADKVSPSSVRAELVEAHVPNTTPVQ